MLICFDLDNTLNDRQSAVEAWIDEFLTETGAPDDDRAWLRELDADGYRPRPEAFKAIRERYDLRPPVDELVTAYRSRVVELSRLVDGAKECLAQFRDAGWSVVIVSNGSSGQQHAKIERLGLRSLVDAAIVSDDIGIKKPDRRIFDEAAAAVEMSLAGSWMVGDAALQDVVGGSRAGMHTAWMARGRRWDPTLDAAPDLTIDHLGELFGLVEGHGS